MHALFLFALSAMPGPFRLNVFGGMQLLPPVDSTPEEQERAALLDNRRRVLSVLTLIALTSRPLTRDQLADYFWSDSEPARARHSVAEALRLLRRVLGDDVLASRAADIMFTAEVPLDCDVTRFMRAHAAGDHGRAAATYAGAFLDGIFVERAPRFEEWADRQRDTLQRMFVTSCAAECRRLAEQGEHAAAATLARRWLDAAPLSVEAAVAWFGAQLAPGTAEALHAARERFALYTAHLAAEYETAPDRRLTQLLESAEQALAARIIVPRTPTPSPELPLAAQTEAPPMALASAPTPGRVAPPPSQQTSAVPQQRTPRRSWAVGATIAAVLTVLVVAGWRTGLIGTDPEAALTQDPATPIVIVMADAENTTTDSLLGDAVKVAMSTALTESGDVNLVSRGRVRELRRLTMASGDSTALREPFADTLAGIVAARMGASAVVVPVVLALGTQYRVALRVVRPSDGRVLGTTQSPAVSSAGLLAAIDDVAQRTRRKLRGLRADGERPRPLPDYTTSSLPALRRYAQGARAFDEHDMEAAIAHYRQAVQLDTAFALGWTALGRVLAYVNQPQAADSAFAVALRHVTRLSEREGMIVRASVLRTRGLPDSAIALRAAWIRSHPDDLEQMRTQLFDLLTRSRRSEAIALGETLARRDSTDANVLTNLALAYEGDDQQSRQRAVELYAKSLRLDPAQLRSQMAPQLYGGVLARAQMFDSASRFLYSFASADRRLQSRAMRALGQVELLRSRPQAAIAPLEQSVQFSREMQDTLSWVRTRLWLANTLYVVGDTVRGRAHMDSLVQEAALLHEPQVQYWIGLQLSRLGRVPDAESVLRSLERTMVASSRVHAGVRALLAAEIATARGQARRVLASVEPAMRDDSSAVTLETVAWTTLQAGDTTRARAWSRVIFERTPGFGTEGWLARDRARAWLARLGENVRP